MLEGTGRVASFHSPAVYIQWRGSGDKWDSNELFYQCTDGNNVSCPLLNAFPPLLNYFIPCTCAASHLALDVTHSESPLL